MPSGIFFTLFIQPTLNVLVAFHKLYLTLHFPGALGLAICTLTIGIRFVLHPFFKKQMHTTKKMQELKPHLDKLSKEHKEDPKKLQAEQMRMYKEAGVNPMAGCLFALVQIPVFIGLYNTLNILLKNGVGVKVIKQINSSLYSPLLKISTIDPMFLGYNLALSPAKAHIWYYYLIPVLTGVLQYFQAKVTMPIPPKVEKKEGEEDVKPSTSDDFQKAMSTQMRVIFPFMIAYFSYQLPVGLALYWNIFSIFSISQYYHINKEPKK